MNNTGKVRINRFDNLKGLAIFLIVLGHMCFLTDLKSIDLLHNFIFIIHLPIFFFVSGYFSKIGPDEPIKAFKRLLIPYIVFCIIYEIYSVFYKGNNPNTFLFIKSGYALWFLISLFTMKLTLPILDKLRYPIFTTFILALLIGCVDADFLGLSRTFVYLPIFLIGFYYKDYKVLLENNYPKINNLLENRIFILLMFALTIFACIIVADALPYKVIMLRNPYAHFTLKNVVIRSIIILLGIINTLILNKIMINSENILTKFGKNSMAVYLLHVYIVLSVRKS